VPSRETETAFPLGESMQASAKSAPFVILFCAALFLFSLTLQFDFPHAPGRLGPDVWPQAILVLLMLTCAIGVVRNFLVRSPGEAAQPAAWSAGEEAEIEVPSRYILVILGFALFLIYPVALEYLGFLAATLLLMALFMWIGQWRSPLGVLATSAIGTLVLFYAFRGIVYVSLLLGVGPFQEWTVWVAQLLNMR
jgi:putative tricarboxylic transport membrane protein